MQHNSFDLVQLGSHFVRKCLQLINSSRKVGKVGIYHIAATATSSVGTITGAYIKGAANKIDWLCLDWQNLLYYFEATGFCKEEKHKLEHNLNSDRGLLNLELTKIITFY